MLLSILIFSFGILLYVMMEMDRKGRGELGKIQTRTKPSYMVHDLPSELPLIYIFDIFYWKNHLCLLPDRY